MTGVRGVSVPGRVVRAFPSCKENATIRNRHLEGSSVSASDAATGYVTLNHARKISRAFEQLNVPTSITSPTMDKCTHGCPTLNKVNNLLYIQWIYLVPFQFYIKPIQVDK